VGREYFEYGFAVGGVFVEPYLDVLEALGGEKAALDGFQEEKSKKGEGEGHQGGNPEAGADGEANGSDHPEAGRGGHAFDVVADLDEGAGAQETDARDHLRGDAAGIAVSLADGRREPDRENHEKTGAQTYEDVRPQARGLPAEFALRADDASGEESENQARGSGSGPYFRCAQQFKNVIHVDQAFLPDAQASRLRRRYVSCQAACFV